MIFLARKASLSLNSIVASKFLIVVFLLTLLCFYLTGLAKKNTDNSGGIRPAIDIQLSGIHGSHPAGSWLIVPSCILSYISLQLNMISRLHLYIDGSFINVSSMKQIAQDLKN